MEKRRIDVETYSRVRRGKIEKVRSYSKNINIIPKLTKTNLDEIRLGKARKLITVDHEKYALSELEKKNIRIPLWFFKTKYKWMAYIFRIENNRFPNNKERILISLNEGGVYYNTKELAEDTGIAYKNISRYIKELEKEKEIVISPRRNNVKAIYLTSQYNHFQDMYKILKRKD